MKFKLVIVAGEGLRNEVDLNTPVVIGRSRQADVTIGHPLVSRRHCEITEGDENLLVVEDLGSLNGTFVGDHRIDSPVYLEPGDYLTIGNITFQALYGEHTQPDFPSEDSGAQATEEMPEFVPSEESDEGEPDEVMFIAEDTEEEADAQDVEPAAADEEDAVEVDELEVLDDAPADETEPVEPAEVSPRPPQENGETGSAGESGLGWLAGSEDSGKKKAGDDDHLEDFFKNL